MRIETKVGIAFMLLVIGLLSIVSAGATEVSIGISKETQDGLTKAGINIEKLEVTELRCLSNNCKFQIKEGTKEIANIQISKCEKKIFGHCYKIKDTKTLETERNAKIKYILEDKAGTSEKAQPTLWEKVLDAGRLLFK